MKNYAIIVIGRIFFFFPNGSLLETKHLINTDWVI